MLVNLSGGTTTYKPIIVVMSSQVVLIKSIIFLVPICPLIDIININ